MWKKKEFYRSELWGKRVLCVATVGKDEVVVREYIRKQDDENRRLEQLTLFEQPPLGGCQGNQKGVQPDSFARRGEKIEKGRQWGLNPNQKKPYVKTK